MRKSMRGKRRGGEDKSFWLCFSDLMSTLVLVLVLIMFYSLYLHFDTMEEATARLLQTEQSLADQEAEIAAQDEELRISNLQLIEREAALNEALAELEQAQLELQASQLSAQEREELLAALQTQLEGQQAQLEDQQAQLEDLIGVRSRIIVELASALNEANVQVDTDQNTGAIRLSSEVLFNVGQAVLKPEGERFLQRFIPVYMDVLLSEEYADSVSEIIIEGHTDSTGTYIENMELSQNRARAVLQYILSSDFTQLSYSEKQALREVVTVNGRSSSDPVLDENGLENMDASRRVEFKFRLHDETMIQQMQELLDSFSIEETQTDTQQESAQSAQ